MYGVRSVLNWIVQINFGLKPKFGLKLKFKQKLKWPSVSTVAGVVMGMHG